jgi:Zn finger protein HypA/HybF involved in hydrogenase expression
MGMSIDAHCYGCGYDTVVPTGSGMANFDTYAAWPVCCNKCNAVTHANMKARSPICEDCHEEGVTSYNGDTLAIGGGTAVHSWEDDLALTSANYLCPKCNEYALQFGTGAGGQIPILFD